MGEFQAGCIDVYLPLMGLGGNSRILKDLMDTVIMRHSQREVNYLFPISSFDEGWKIHRDEYGCCLDQLFDNLPVFCYTNG